MKPQATNMCGAPRSTSALASAVISCRCVASRWFARGLLLLAVWVVPALVAAQNFAPPGVVVPNVAAPPQYLGGAGGVFRSVTLPSGTEFVGPASQLRGTLGYARKVGLQMSIGSNWPGEQGYRPVKVKFSSRTPATADKKILVRFFAGPWYSRGRAIVVEQELTLATGDSSTSATLLAPQYVDWQEFGWEVTVDGDRIDELGVEHAYFPQQGNTGGVSALAAPPALAATLPAALQPLTGGVGVVHGIKAADLPTNWLQYSTVDVMIMRAADFAQFAKAHPDQATALLRWIRAGGNLWLLEAGDDWSQLSVVDAALGAGEAERVGNALATDETMGNAAWRFLPVGERAIQPVEAALAISRFDTTGEAAKPAEAPIAAERRRRGQPVPQAPTVSATAAKSVKARPLGLGAVAVFVEGLSTPDENGASPLMDAIRQSLLGMRSTQNGRMGNAAAGANAEFNNWLIPDVGVAPVGQFQFLISLFVIGIGPLNYWWLKRRKNLPMLLVTAPLAASLVTAALLSYGILADGFGIRARARSLTLLDQRSGEAASWARLSYYAGVTPEGGLVMPTDVAMFPIQPTWADDGGMRRGGNDRALRWTDKQELTRGWLNSRTPTQYLAVAARPTAKRLELRVGDKGLRIFNRLGVRVLQVAVQDHDGKQYWCEDLPDGDGRVVPEVEHTVIATAMRRTFSANFPEFPPGGEESWYGSYYGNKLSQNLMETRIEALNSPMVQGWGDGSYVAITDRGAEVDLGLENVREEQSFHVIEGSW